MSFTDEVANMMITFGDLMPVAETIRVIEKLIKCELRNLIIAASDVAAHRMSSCSYTSAEDGITPQDFLFLLRKDGIRFSRLSSYLSWRKVRKIANRMGNLPLQKSNASNQADFVSLEEDWFTLQDPLLPLRPVGDSPISPTSPVHPENRKENQLKSSQTDIFQVTRDLTDSFNYLTKEDHFNTSDDFFPTSESTNPVLNDISDELYSLFIEDEHTRNMHKDAYIAYAAKRQNSFTYKRSHIFQSWLGLQVYMGHSLLRIKPFVLRNRPEKANINPLLLPTNEIEFLPPTWVNQSNNLLRTSSDLLDVLGFFAFELVRNITEMSLVVMKEWNSKKQSLKVVDPENYDDSDEDIIDQLEGFSYKADNQKQSPFYSKNLLHKIDRQFQTEKKKWSIFESDGKEETDSLWRSEGNDRINNNSISSFFGLEDEDEFTVDGSITIPSRSKLTVPSETGETDIETASMRKRTNESSSKRSLLPRHVMEAIRKLSMNEPFSKEFFMKNQFNEFDNEETQQKWKRLRTMRMEGARNNNQFVLSKFRRTSKIRRPFINV